MLDIYHEAMTKKTGRYQAMVEYLAVEIIGEQTLVHCVPASSARTPEIKRVPIPFAIRKKMQSKLYIILLFI